MVDGEYNYVKAYQQLISAKNSHRTIEEIVVDMQNELRPIKEESLLVHAMRLFVELDNRAASLLYEHLQSPMRQTLYMVDVYYSIVDRTETVEMDEERWDRIALLLDEIEMTYFVNIAFPNEGDLFHDERDDQKLRTSDKWREKISNALNNATIAVLLISPYFVASDFIVNNELQPLLENAEKKGVKIMPVMVSPCETIEESGLLDYQAPNGPDKTLIEMTKGEVHRTLSKLVKDIKSFIDNKK